MEDGNSLPAAKQEVFNEVVSSELDNRQEEMDDENRNGQNKNMEDGNSLPAAKQEVFSEVVSSELDNGQEEMDDENRNGQNQSMDVEYVLTAGKKDVSELCSSDNPTLSERQDEINVINSSTGLNQNCILLDNLNSLTKITEEDVNDEIKCLNSPIENKVVENGATSDDLVQTFAIVRSLETSNKEESEVNCSLIPSEYKEKVTDVVDSDESSVQNIEYPEDEIRSQATNCKNSRNLINQSLSLPYYKITRPDFHEFTCNAAKNLEVPTINAMPKKQNGEKKNEESDDIIILWEAKPRPNNRPSSSSNLQENNTSQREDLIKNLKIQMQQKKEAAFDMHKKIQLADDEIYISDSDEYEAIPCSAASGYESDGISQASVATSSSIGIEMKHDDLEVYRDSQTVSLSLPSYQPGGGFIDQYDTSKDNDSSDIVEVYSSPQIQRSCVKEFAVIKNNLNFDASQDVDDVSTICSGHFLSVDNERPWTPTSDSQKNKERESEVESKIDNNENMDAEESNSKDFHDGKSVNDNDSKRKRENSSLEIFSPPLKKYKSGLTNEASEILLPSNKNKIVMDAYGKSSFSEDSFASEQINEEEFENDEIEEQEIVPRIKRCKPLPDESDNDEEEEKILIDSQLNESSSQNRIDGNILNLNKINDFFDDEAELSGEEMSSDESEGNEGDDEAEQEQIPDDIPEDEELKEQVANIYFKHEQDEDARMVKKLQQDFLPEGELHVDGSGRQKRFNWSNNDSSNIQNEKLSDSEPEDNADTSIHQDKMKWRQETSKIQKVSDGESSDVDVEVKSGNAKKLPISIVGKAHSSQSTIEANKNVGKSPFTRRHGSLIHAAGYDGLNLNVPSSTQRKTVLFQNLEQENKLYSSPSKENKL